MTAIETPRLHLRPATAADIDVLHRMWMHPDVRRYLWDDIVIDRETAASVVAHSDHDWRERRYGLWLIELRDGREVAGFAGLRSTPPDGDAELIFGLLPQFWRRGYATEAARAVLTYAFDELAVDSVWAATDPPNEASIRAMERAGMTFKKSGALGGVDALFFRMNRGT